MTYDRFTLAYWCIFIVALLPLICALIAKSGQVGKPRKDGGYDNNQPRAWLAKQTDWRARANAAQQNSFEVLPFFFAAVIMAQQLGAPQARLDVMAFLFVFLRLFYILAYIADMPTVRSVVWGLGLFVNIGIFFLGYH
jgi:uncharacterized MAPEG superfamily protein